MFLYLIHILIHELMENSEFIKVYFYGRFDRNFLTL